MSALVRAELLKLRTTRAWIGFTLVVVALAGIATAGTVGTAEDVDRSSGELSQDIFSGSLLAALVAFLVGIVSVTAEWRHGTVTRTFLVAPRRGLVLVAKLLSIAVVALTLLAVALAVVLAIALPWLAAKDASLVVDGEQAEYLVRLVLVTMLWGALGVGVGAAVQSQTPALVGAVVWILLVEALLTALLGLIDLETVGEYLPGQSLSSFDGSEDGGLSPWPAGAVALAWVVAFGLLGHLRMSRRDVT